MWENQKDVINLIDHCYYLKIAQGHFSTKTPPRHGSEPMTFLTPGPETPERTPSQKTLQQRGEELFSGGGCSH